MRKTVKKYGVLQEYFLFIFLDVFTFEDFSIRIITEKQQDFF